MIARNWSQNASCSWQTVRAIAFNETFTSCLDCSKYTIINFTIFASLARYHHRSIVLSSDDVLNEMCCIFGGCLFRWLSARPFRLRAHYWRCRITCLSTTTPSTGDARAGWIPRTEVSNDVTGPKRHLHSKTKLPTTCHSKGTIILSLTSISVIRCKLQIIHYSVNDAFFVIVIWIHCKDT